MRSARTLLAVFVVLRVIVMIVLSLRTSPTIDELDNYDAAQVTFHAQRLNRQKDSEMPVTLVNAAIGEPLLRIAPSVDHDLATRLGSIVVNQAAVPLAFLLALELGASAAMALGFAFVIGFEPSILHHSILVTVDGAMTTFSLLLTWVGARWTRAPDRRKLIVFGLALGLLQGVKLSAAYTVPLCVAWVVFRSRNDGVRSAAKSVGIFLFAAWLGLALIFGFNRLGAPLGEIAFRSPLFKDIANAAPWLPAPAPVDYLRGLDWVYSIERGARNVFIRGNNYKAGVPYYYVYTLLLKTPLPLLVFAVWGWIRRLRRKPLDAKTGFIVMLFVALFFYFSFIFKNQIGIRYILPIYPLFLIGMIWVPLLEAEVGAPRRRWAAALAGAWVAISMLVHFPDFIGYFNELVPNRSQRWWHLGDSSLAWEQERGAWQRFARENAIADSRINPPVLPLEDSFYIDANRLTYVWPPDFRRTEWFVRHTAESPEDSFRGIWLKFRLTPAQIIDAQPEEALRIPPRSLSTTECAPNSFDLSRQGARWSVASEAPGRLSGVLLVPESGSVFLQLNSTLIVDLRISEVPMLKVTLAHYREEGGPWSMYMWRRARVKLAAGAYPFEIDLAPQQFPRMIGKTRWERILEERLDNERQPKVYFAAHLLTEGGGDKNAPRATARALSLCGVQGAERPEQEPDP